MNIAGLKSIELQKRAEKVLPLGVNSNFRYCTGIWKKLQSIFTYRDGI